MTSYHNILDFIEDLETVEMHISGLEKIGVSKGDLFCEALQSAKEIVRKLEEVAPGSRKVKENPQAPKVSED